MIKLRVKEFSTQGHMTNKPTNQIDSIPNPKVYKSLSVDSKLFFKSCKYVGEIPSVFPVRKHSEFLLGQPCLREGINIALTDMF